MVRSRRGEEHQLEFRHDSISSCVSEPILELAKKILTSYNRPHDQIIFRPLPQDDPKQRRPDISAAKRLLNWTPRIGLDDGLSKTIDWFRSQAQPSVTS